MMDAVVRSGDGAYPWQEGFDDLSFDGFDGWLKETSLYEDLQATPAGWPSFDFGGGPNVVADQKLSVEPTACTAVSAPKYNNHLTSQSTSSAATIATSTATSSYYFITSHVRDDESSTCGIQTWSNAALPEVFFRSITHSSTVSARQTPNSLHARRSQPQMQISTSNEQCRTSHTHRYAPAPSPSVYSPSTRSFPKRDSRQAQVATETSSMHPSSAHVLSSLQYEFGSGNFQNLTGAPTTPSTIYSPTPLNESPAGQNLIEYTTLSTKAATKTSSEERSFSYSATIPLASSNAQSLLKTKRKRDNYDLNSTCSEVALKDKYGAVAAYSQVFGTARNLRQAYSDGQRREIARTRRLGACERCKRFKMKCHRPDSPYELCLRCVLSSPQVLSMPCFLAKPVEAELFRDKPSVMHPLQTPRSEVYRLIDIAVPQYQFTKLKLTQDLGETLDVYVTQYEPRPNEKTSHPWKDRSKIPRALEMPPYCIANMSDVRKRMLGYITACRSTFLSKLRMSCNEITGEIIDEARRYAAFNPASTVRKAIDLFAATRIIENDWRICGEETLGVDVVEDEENPWFGKIPVTPIMDTQLDQIVIQGFLKPLRDKLLHELQTKIYETRRENWFEIFLTISLLLTNAELLLLHSRKNAERYGASRRYNSLERAYKYFHTCNLLIAHFHFVCVGFVPLKLDWSSTNASSMAVLDLEQIRFMVQLQEMIQRKEKYVLSLRAKREYESELYWCHQLFFEKWEWEKPKIEDGVEED